jgi:LPXTG-motif cell wall-anchored protein
MKLPVESSHPYWFLISGFNIAILAGLFLVLFGRRKEALVQADIQLVFAESEHVFDLGDGAKVIIVTINPAGRML